MLTAFTCTGLEGPPPVDEMLYVEIRERNLHIGNSTYPVANIARLNLETMRPNKEQLKQLYFDSVKKRLLTGVIVAAIIAALLGLITSATTALTVGLALGLIVSALLIVADTRDLNTAMEFKYHILAVETNGEPFASIQSRNQGELEKLKGLIEDAINNPRAEFAMKIEMHVGDTIFGDKILGDKVRTSGPNSPGKVVK